MQILPIQTKLVSTGDDLAGIIAASIALKQNDIIVVSSKAAATCEGRAIGLKNITPSDDAIRHSKGCGRSPEFCEAVLAELKRLHGRVVGSCPGALLTEVKPDGLQRGVIAIANAGLDESNTPRGTAIGWPVDAVKSAIELRRRLEDLASEAKNEKRKTKNQIALIISDSCVRPRRLGVAALALTVSGMKPFASQAGRSDLFGKPLRVTTEAIADQLATAANAVMGNADQSIPAAIIRDHDVRLESYDGWVDGIEPDEDLFRGIV